MLKSLTVLLVAALALAGCCTTPPVKVVYKDRLVYPSDEQLRDCDVEAPPAKADYLRKEADPIKTAEERERMLTNFGKNQTNNVVNCNVRWKNLRKEKADLQQKLEADKASGKKE